MADKLTKIGIIQQEMRDVDSSLSQLRRAFRQLDEQYRQVKGSRHGVEHAIDVLIKRRVELVKQYDKLTVMQKPKAG